MFTTFFFFLATQQDFPASSSANSLPRSFLSSPIPSHLIFVWLLRWKRGVVILRGRKPSLPIIPEPSWTLGGAASLQDDPSPAMCSPRPHRTELTCVHFWGCYTRHGWFHLALSWITHSGRRRLPGLEDTQAAPCGDPGVWNEGSHRQPALTRQRHETGARLPGRATSEFLTHRS